MEDEKRMFGTAKEMAEQLQTKAAEIKQFQAEKSTLEDALKKALKEAAEAKQVCRTRVNMAQQNYHDALVQLGGSKIIEARLKIIEDEMDLLQYAVGVNSWSVEIAKMIEDKLRGIVTTAKSIAQSARENAVEI